MNALEVHNLTKKFGNFTAVDSVNFEVGKGEIFAFIGPNGAGKTTTIKMLTTILSPSSGEMTVNGFNAVKEHGKVRESFGIIFQDPSLDDDLTAYENLEYHAVLYRVPKERRRKKIENLLKFVGMLDRKDDLVKTFSGGMKRRVEIARGLLHQPEILFLDEPTIGLDVQTRTFLWENIKKMSKKKKLTVFLTTHDLNEAERIADRICIIDHGKIITIGTSKEIKKQTKSKTLEKAFLKLTGRDIRIDTAKPIDKMRVFRRMRH